MTKITTALLTLTSFAIAADSIASLEQNVLNSKLVTKTGLSYEDNTGNTVSNKFSLALDAKKSWGKHIFTFDFDMDFASADKKEDKNIWYTQLSYDRVLNSTLAVNYLINYKDDRYANLERFNTGPGLMYQTYKSTTMLLNTQLNILYAKENKIINSQWNDRDFIASQVGFDYTWKITNNFTFTQNATYNIEVEDNENFTAYSKTSVESKITDMFALGVSYKVDYVNVPASGKEATDTKTLVQFIINY
ncbi:MAG: DUF481 domain-containing protein [Helicobacteraceae bacterium]|nr:DUF481 domain-containing protein [Helicobacteraceae bacterium]